MSPVPQKHAKLFAVQVLRGVASVGVLLDHVLHEARTLSGHLSSWTFFPFAAGVDLFFVISGFIMVYTSDWAFGQAGAPREFLWRRLIRIVPLYYIFTTLIIGVVLLAPSTLHTTSLDVDQFITSYLFWPYQRAGSVIHPVLGVGWTLNYEMFFYALFAACLPLREKIALPTLTVIMVALVLIGALVDIPWGAVKFWTDPIILEFCAGMWLGYRLIHRPDTRIPWPLALAALASAFAILIAPTGVLLPHRALKFGLPATLLIWAAIRWRSPWSRRLVPRWAVALGDSSYSLYLVHLFPLRLCSVLWRRLNLSGSLGISIFLSFAVVVCVMVGQLTYLYIEKPLLRFLRNLSGSGARLSPPGKPSS